MKIIDFFYTKIKETIKEVKQFKAAQKSYSLITIWITMVAFYGQETFGCS